MKVLFMIGALVFLTGIGYSQTILSNEDIQINLYNLDLLGKEFWIKNNLGQDFPAGDYVYNFVFKEKPYPVSFTVDSLGKTQGTLIFPGILEGWVKDGIICKYEAERGTGKLMEEGYMRGDTAIKVYYNKYGQKRSEYHSLDEEIIYDYNCSYYESTDSLSNCTLRDKINGVYIFYYEGGIMESRLVVKGLPKGVKEVYEEFDEKGHRKFIQTTYTNRDQKKIYANGDYEMISNNAAVSTVKKYSKTGKLIKSYELSEPTAPSN